MTEMSIPNAISLAQQHLRAGRLAEAEAVCRNFLRNHPSEHTVFRLLGIVAYHAGKLEDAQQYLEQAISLDSQVAEYHDNLSVVLQKQGKIEEAETAVRRAIAIKPTAEAFNNLGIISKAQGRQEEAIGAYREALRVQPNHLAAYNNLGVELQAQGKPEEATLAYRRALAIQPNFADAHNNLAITLHSQGQLEKAVESYRQALAIRPNYAEAENNLGNVLKDQGRLEESLEAYRRALAIRPNYTDAECNMGNVLFDLKRFEEALDAFQRALILQPVNANAENGRANVMFALDQLKEAEAAYRRALAIRPNFADAQNNLGNVFRARGLLELAEQAYRRALEIRPTYAEASNNLGGALKDQGLLEEAIEAYEQALQIQPNYHVAHSNLVYCHQFRQGVRIDHLVEIHAEWDRRHALPIKSTWRPFPNSRDPDRKIRLGFVSGNFARHPCGYFLIGGLEVLDRADFETVLYSDRVNKDDLTDRIAAAAGTWREVSDVSDQDLADLMREDGIDVLIGMGGHTRGNRLLLLARKPAPILVSWTGYPGSIGLSAIDYLLADRFHIPEELEEKYTEKIIRLPDGYVCYEPPDYAPEVGSLPSEKNGYVTFGSFNQASKYTSEVVRVWSEILRRLPDSRLLLKSKGFNDKTMCRRFGELFSGCGVDASQLEFEGAAPHAKLLARYERIDITLDPFPFSGGLTTCESLWMGVPVITWPGETFASRHSLSHLSNVGLTKTIAKDLDEYVEIALRLAQDLSRLAELRLGSRERMAKSPLCDGKRYAKNFMKALRGVWHEWCEKQ